VLTDSGQLQHENQLWGRTADIGNPIPARRRARSRRSKTILRSGNPPAACTPAANQPDGGSQTDLVREHLDTQERLDSNESDRLTADQDALVVEHLPSVRFIARRIHERLPQHVPIEDLFSAGVIGLMDACRKFDSTKQAKFSTYAQFRIRGAILDNLRALDWSPRELRSKGRSVEQAIQTLTARLNRAPQEEEISRELEIDLADYHHLLGELRNLEIGSLHEKRWEDSGEEELDYLSSAPEDDPLFRCLHGEMRRRLTAAIETLPERERLLMTLYYYEELTMKEIAVVLDVTPARASRLHASAVLRLRAKTADMGIRDRQILSPNRVMSLPARLDPRKRRDK
jgi:RNA polymerase sigma factor FliA